MKEIIAIPPAMKNLIQETLDKLSESMDIVFDELYDKLPDSAEIRNVCAGIIYLRISETLLGDILETMGRKEKKEFMAVLEEILNNVYSSKLVQHIGRDSDDYKHSV